MVKINGTTIEEAKAIGVEALKTLKQKAADGDTIAIGLLIWKGHIILPAREKPRPKTSLVPPQIVEPE